MTPPLPQQFGNLEANLRFVRDTGIIRPGVRLLEIGSGTGAMLHALIEQGADAHGVELRQDLIDEAQRHFGPLPIERVYGTTLPFPDDSFEVVASFDVFEHIPDTDAHLAEVRRVLQPGGWLRDPDAEPIYERGVRNDPLAKLYAVPRRPLLAPLDERAPRASPEARLRTARLRCAGGERLLQAESSNLRGLARHARTRAGQPRSAPAFVANELIHCRPGPAAAVIRNFAYSMVSTATAALLLALMIIAGRFLGEVEFGKFMFALLLGGVFETLMDFGLHQVTVRAIARDPDRAPILLRHTLAIKLLWATGALMLLIVATNTLRKEPDVRMACYLIGGASIFRSYMLTIRGVLQGLERFGWESIVVIADRALLLTLGTYALWSGGGLRGLTIAFVAARGLALLLAAVITQIRLGGIALTYDRDAWRDLHLTALPLGFFLIVLNLYQYADGVMLGYFRNDAETGLYGAAFKIYEGLTYAATAISAVLTPRLSALFVSDRTRHRQMSIGGVAGTAGIGALIAIVGFIASAAAADDPLRQRVRRRGPTVPYSLRRPADSLRDLDPACDRHFGRSREAAAADRVDRPGGQRRLEPVLDPALRPERRRVGYGRRRTGQYGDPDCGVASSVVDCCTSSVVRIEREGFGDPGAAV